jgi:uncharacterized protein (DUF4415 family)
MRKSAAIRRASAADIAAMRSRGEVRSDWHTAEARSQAEAERLATDEDGALPEGWEATVELGIPAPKQAVHIRLDADVLAWFRAEGAGYQTRINAVLRAFVQAKQRTGAG